MLLCHPQDECGCLPSCQAFPRGRCLGPQAAEPGSGPREGVLWHRGCGPLGDQLLAPHHPSVR